MAKNDNKPGKNVPAKKAESESEESVLLHLQRSEFYAGPFPSPEMLRKYNEIDPGLVNRIFDYAERDQEHRHSIEREKVSIDRKEVTVSFLAHAITNACITAMFISLLLVGGYALSLGHTKTALAIFAVPIGRMVIAMTHMVRKEPDAKKKSE